MQVFDFVFVFLYFSVKLFFQILPALDKDWKEGPALQSSLDYYQQEQCLVQVEVQIFFVCQMNVCFIVLQT
jgi:hypothetical protein